MSGSKSRHAGKRKAHERETREDAVRQHRKSVRRPTNDKLDGAGAQADNGKGKDGARATSFKKRYGQTEKSGKIFHSVRAPALGGLRHRHRGVLRRVRRRASNEPRRLPHRRDLAHLRRQRKPVRATPAHRVQRALRHHLLDVRLLRRDDHLSRDVRAHRRPRAHFVAAPSLCGQALGGEGQPRLDEGARLFVGADGCGDRGVLLHPESSQHRQPHPEHGLGGDELPCGISHLPPLPSLRRSVRGKRHRPHRALGDGDH